MTISPRSREASVHAPARGDGIGASVLRVEDPRLLRGAGRYVSDIDLPGQLHCVLVRSPHAHARIRGIDIAKSAISPGVAAVFSVVDMAADGIRSMRCLWAIRSRDGKPMAEPPRRAL